MKKRPRRTPGSKRAPRVLGVKRALRVLGVMTGTSCDGLDAACIAADGGRWQTLWAGSLKYPAGLRKRVLEAQRGGRAPDGLEALELDRDLGEWYGVSIQKLLKSRQRAARPDVVANHGQTVAHRPRAGVTWQLGDPSRIAARTGLTVVSHFRHGDLAAGGEGAPLAPLFHKLLAGKLADVEAGIAIHNIGGISNLTYLGPKDRILAFDTGPGNIWIDAAAAIATRGKARMDIGGRLAERGEMDIPAVRAILRHPYFAKALPKSTGRDDFPIELLLKHTRARGTDLVATATAVTVESIARAYERFIVARGLPLGWILVSGGGARNPLLMAWLKDRMPEVKLVPIEETGLDSRFIEAEAFAVFGYLSLAGQALGGSWTGAKGFAPPGWITPGENWLAVLKIVASHCANQGANQGTT